MAAFLALAATSDAAEAALPVHGSWDCGAMSFSLDATRYNDTVAVESVERIAEDAFGVTLKDGYRFALFDVTARTLTWHSPESGDTFDCRRIG